MADNTWTILNESGGRFVEFSTLISIDVKNENLVVSIPIEKGSFANYNKVASPLDINVILAFEGDNSKLQSALETMDEFSNGTDLLTLATPSAVYADLNLETYSYKKDASTGVLACDCHFVEIRQVETQTTTTEYTKKKCKNPTSAGTNNTGTANKTDAGASILSDLEKRLFGKR